MTSSPASSATPEDDGFVVPTPSRRRRATQPDPAPQETAPVPEPGNGIAVPETTAPVPTPPQPAAPPTFPASFPTQPPRAPGPELNLGGLGFLQPPPATQGYQRRQENDVLSLRADAALVSTYRKNQLIAQGVCDVPDGVIPGVAVRFLVENFGELIRRAVLEVHGVDMGNGNQPNSNGQ